ncbi:hypothetical protein JTB14_017639 [Gonioctena quinquepunctata]|nr:hypothetical protein JTB14_017639 [Gonioctena quinquepunctata]
MEAVTLESATLNEQMIMEMKERQNGESNIIILNVKEPNQQTLGNRTKDKNSTREILKEIDVDTSNDALSVLKSEQKVTVDGIKIFSDQTKLQIDFFFKVK